MKSYSAKTIEEATKMASEELGIPEDELIFKVVEEKKGILSKKATIEVFELTDVIEFAENYIKDVITSLGVGGVTTKTSLEDDIIRIEIDSDHNPILIGKNGVTLQALNEIVRLAVSGKFRRRFRVLLDIGDYKDVKYSRVAALARRTAKEVQKYPRRTAGRSGGHQDQDQCRRQRVHRPDVRWTHPCSGRNGTGHERPHRGCRQTGHRHREVHPNRTGGRKIP